MKALRKKVETVAFMLMSRGIPRLSRPAILRLARFLTFVGFQLPTHMKKVGQANIRLVYGDRMTPAGQKALLRQAYATFILTMLDSIWFSWKTTERVQRHVRFDAARLAEVLKPGATICVTGHFGNWEMLGHMTALNGHPLASVYKPLKNPDVDREFRRMRTVAGQDIVETRGAFRKLYRLLKEGRKIGLVMDQNTHPKSGGAYFDFLGTPALVSTAAAALAIHTGTPILAGFCKPLPDGNYEVYAPKDLIDPAPFAADGEQGVLDLTTEIVKRLEQGIRENPGYWLWMYKRWKYIPEGADRNKFPFYAKSPKWQKNTEKKF